MNLSILHDYTLSTLLGECPENSLALRGLAGFELVQVSDLNHFDIWTTPLWPLRPTAARTACPQTL